MNATNIPQHEMLNNTLVDKVVTITYKGGYKRTTGVFVSCSKANNAYWIGGSKWIVTLLVDGKRVDIPCFAGGPYVSAIIIPAIGFEHIFDHSRP